MTVPKSYIKGKQILAVDDEEDILETIADVLEEAHVDRAGDYATASRKIKEKRRSDGGAVLKTEILEIFCRVICGNVTQFICIWSGQYASQGPEISDPRQSDHDARRNDLVSQDAAWTKQAADSGSRSIQQIWLWQLDARLASSVDVEKGPDAGELWERSANPKSKVHQLLHLLRYSYH